MTEKPIDYFKFRIITFCPRQIFWSNELFPSSCSPYRNKLLAFDKLSCRFESFDLLGSTCLTVSTDRFGSTCLLFWMVFIYGHAFFCFEWVWREIRARRRDPKFRWCNRRNRTCPWCPELYLQENNKAGMNLRSSIQCNRYRDHIRTNTYRSIPEI